MQEITVQIVNYRTRRYLRPCIESLLPALRSGRILVLDNASGDDLSGLTDLFGEKVEVHTSTENLGFGAGHNRLAALGHSPLLCCVNPDTVLRTPDGLGRLAALGAAAAGPRLVNGDGSPQRWDHGELTGVRARVANAAGHAHWRPRGARTDAAWVSGAFMLLDRARFAEVGGFDESFFLYKEDEDLCRRLRAAGGRVVHEPAVTVEHAGSVVAERDPALLAAAVDRYRRKHGTSALARAAYRVTRRF